MDSGSSYFEGWKDLHQYITHDHKQGGIDYTIHNNSKLKQFLELHPRKVQPFKSPDEGVSAVLLPCAENVRLPTLADPPKCPELFQNKNIIGLNFKQDDNNKREHKNTNQNNTMYCNASHEVSSFGSCNGGDSAYPIVESTMQSQVNMLTFNTETCNRNNGCNNPPMFSNKGDYGTPNRQFNYIIKKNKKNEINFAKIQKNFKTSGSFINVLDSGCWGDSGITNDTHLVDGMGAGVQF